MKNLLIFLGGVATGAVCSLLYLNKYVIPELRKEAEKEQEAKTEYDISEEEKPGFDYAEGSEEPDVVVRGDDAKKLVKDMASKKDYHDYTKYSAGEESKGEEPEEPDDEDAEAVSSGPYIIDEDELNEYSSYHTFTFDVYSDGIFMDAETEEVLDADPLATFGETAIEELKKHPIVCVRDDTRKCEYRLENKDVPFNEPDDILAPPPEIDWGE